MKKGILQNFIIVLLLLSAAFLTLRLWSLSYGGQYVRTDQAFQNLLSYLTGSTGQQAETSELSFQSLLKPQDIILYNNTETSCFYSGTNTADAYEQLAPYLTDSFSSPHYVAKTELTWSEVLQSSGVLIDYGTAITYQFFSLLADAPDFGSYGALSLRHVYLSLESNAVQAYFEDCTTGTIYRARSSNPILAESFSGMLRDFLTTPNAWYSTMLFADFSESKQAEGLSSLALSPLTKCSFSPVAGVVTAENPLYNTETKSFNAQPLHNILLAFGFNPSTLNQYPEADGTTVYVENFSTVRIGTSGKLEYSVSSTDKGLPVSSILASGNVQTAADMIAAACTLLDGFEDSVTGGNAQLLLRSISFDRESKSYQIDFDYSINGIRIETEDDYAARLSFRDGYLTQAELLFVSYHQSSSLSSRVSFEKASALLLTKHTPDELHWIAPLYRLIDPDIYAPAWQGYGA